MWFNGSDDCSPQDKLNYSWTLIRDGEYEIPDGHDCEDQDGWCTGLNVKKTFNLQHGNYTVILRVRDENNRISPQTPQSTKYFDIPPPAYDIDDLNLASGEVTITADKAINDTVLINLKNVNDELVGKIWMFDISSLKYTASSPTGKYDMIAENGALLYSDRYQNYSYLRKELSIYEEDGIFALRIIQLMSTTDFGIGGSGGTYRIYSRLLENQVRDDDDIYMFKIQFYGENGQGWRDYFKNFYGFDDRGSSTVEYEIPDSVEFLLSHSIIKVSLVGI
jgi:hypothetical protein